MLAAVLLFNRTTDGRVLALDLERRGVSRRVTFGTLSVPGLAPAVRERIGRITDAQRARGLRLGGGPFRAFRARLPLVFILVLPALFAAGMMTMDTTDQILMLGAYDWAFLRPIRKLYYNLTITFISVVIAFVVGGIEVLSVIGGQLRLSGGIRGSWPTSTSASWAARSSASSWSAGSARHCCTG